MTLAEWNKEDIRIRHQLHCAKMLSAKAKSERMRNDHDRLVRVYETHIIPAHVKHKPAR